MSRIALCTALLACLGILACSTETGTGFSNDGATISPDAQGPGTPGTLVTTSTTSKNPKPKTQNPKPKTQNSKPKRSAMSPRDILGIHTL